VQRAVFEEIVEVGVILDPVGAEAGLLAHSMADVIGTVHFPDAFGNFQLPPIAEQRVEAGGRERTRGDEHPRTWDYAVVDGGFDVDVGVLGAFGFKVAHGCEAVQQCGAHVDRSADGALGDGLLKQLRAVVGIGDVSAEQDVGMGVDESRQDGRAAEVDDRRRGDRRADLADALVCDDDHGVGAHGGGLAVDQAAAADSSEFGAD
jgi:hypothetical protein